MSNLSIHTFQWSGMPGAPGYTNFYTLKLPGADPEVARSRFWDFFNKMKAFVPGTVTITPNSTYKVVDEVTGHFVDEQSYSDSPSAITGTGNANYAGPSGACVTWRTATPGARALIRGRTFIVPTSTNIMQTDGTIIDSALVSMRQFAQELIGSFDPLDERFVIYKRPVLGAGGKAAIVTGSSIADRIAILRSRRD
jgi:hypothetical protein